MDASSEYPTAPTINLYNIHLQQQQQHHHHHHQQQQQQQQQQQHQHQIRHPGHSLHSYAPQQDPFCDPSPSPSSGAGMMWESHHKKRESKASYILSPPQDEFRPQPNYGSQASMYYDKSSSSAAAAAAAAAAGHGFYQHTSTHHGLKTEDTASLFIDSSMNRQPIMTMHTREENNSQSSSAPSTCSNLDKKSRDTEKPTCAKEALKKSGVLQHNHRPVVEKKRYRRESHNAVERRRRNNINDNIKSLGQLLPDNMCEGKLNKGSILKGSVVYIHMLNEQLSQYKERLETLQYEAAHISTTNANTTTTTSI